MNAHSQLNARVLLQGAANLQRASRRLLWAVKKNECHPVSRRHAYEFAVRLRCLERFGGSDDLIEFLEQLNLLIVQKFGKADDVDQKEVCDLWLQIGLCLHERILRAHPLGILIMPLLAVESKQDMQRDFAVTPGYRSIMPSSGRRRCFW